MTAQKKTLLLKTILLISLYACETSTPKFEINGELKTINAPKGVILRAIAIEQYDNLGNFIGKKNIYKNPKSNGGNIVYLFQENPDYYFNGDSLAIKKGDIYRIKIKVLGFDDSLTFKP